MKRIWLNPSELHKEWNPQLPLSVMGATGSGKTSTVLNLVKKRFPEDSKWPLLISVDAITVYRFLDVGSAKPYSSGYSFGRDDFSWLGLDLFDPDQEVSVSDFLKAIQPFVLQALESKRPLILVGGSHFYERALLEGMATGAASSPQFLNSLKNFSNQELWLRLQKINPSMAERWHMNDRYRVERYLDLCERQGLTLEQLQQKKSIFSSFDISEAQCVALGMEVAPRVYDQILEQRINKMLESGWIDETKRIVDKFGRDCVALKCVGYREILLFLSGEITESELPTKILISHRQLAKKQRTWIRGLFAQ